MKPEAAKELIKKTFEDGFDKDRFTWFVKNLFPDKIEFRNKVYTGNYIKEAYRAYIRKYEQVGKYEDAEGNTIDLLAVELLRGQSVERARTSQRNFIAQYLKNKNHREGALVAFYSKDSDDWRFSLIKMEYSLEKKQDELTPAKRFSFLVGKNEKSHTAQNQLTGLLTMQSVPTLAEIEAAFNIETVTKEFFEKYKELFWNLNDHIEKEIKKSKQLREELESKSIDSVSFTKKLLGQIVFLYFVQKKGWLGVAKDGKWGEGNKKYLTTLLQEAISKNKKFFPDYLVYLFYEALATEHRGGSDSSYYKKLDCRIPFLNGGLFEADYDWEKIQVDIPNKYFTNKNKTVEGDEGNGILDVFDRYNFTVKEDEPLEKEVAVDPEMLGKVFENLLEVKDRKSKGAFYTPREIVHYMCQESLISYLDTAMNSEPACFKPLGAEQVEFFGNQARKGQLFIEEEYSKATKVPRQNIEKFIREGITSFENDERKMAGYLVSKSFGLHESVRTYSSELDQALANIRICDPAIGSGAFPVGMMNEIVKARSILGIYLPQDYCKKNRTALYEQKKSQQSSNPTNHSSDIYELKRHTIQECIYGVDIEHSAIDIAKLRLWLSLVVDEEDFYKIKPLPNLDYKIVEGNSLDNVVIKDLFASAIFTEIEKLKYEFFEETNLSKKKALRKQINKLFKELTGNEKHFDFEIYFSEIYHKKRGDKKGFDIVIGNPPWGSKLSTEEKNILKEKYSEIDSSTPNSFAYFLGLAKKISKGTVAFVLPDSILIKDYSKTRKLLKPTASVLKWFQNIGMPENLKPFINVEHDVCLIIFNCNPTNDILCSKTFYDTKKKSFVHTEWNAKKEEMIFEEFDYAFNLMLTKKDLSILDKIRKFKSIDKYLQCHEGIHTGNAREILFKEKKENKFCKPLYYGGGAGDEINNYISKRNGWYVDYRAELIDKKKGFYASLRDERIFLHPKIYITRTGNPFKAFIDNDSYASNNFFSLQFTDYNENNIESLKVILPFIISKLAQYFIRTFAAPRLGDTFVETKIIHLLKFRIPELSEKEEKKIITLVDKILEAKKQDANTNTASKERQLDIMVYHLYNLSYTEAKIIDAELSEEEFEKYKID